MVQDLNDNWVISFDPTTTTPLGQFTANFYRGYATALTSGIAPPANPTAVTFYVRNSCIPTQLKIVDTEYG